LVAGRTGQATEPASSDDRRVAAEKEEKEKKEKKRGASSALRGSVVASLTACRSHTRGTAAQEEMLARICTEADPPR